MKKLFALILALVMMTALSVPAFAVEGEGSTNGLTALSDQIITVVGKYVLPVAGTTYNVDIEWSGMVFTFTANSVWDAAQGKTVPAADGSGTWSTNQGTITITNKSNAGVTADLSFDGVGEDEAKVTGQFSKTTLEMAAAAGGTTPSDSTTFKVTGGKIASEMTIGTITISLSAAPIES